MKKIFYFLTILSLLVSCSSDDDSAPNAVLMTGDLIISEIMNNPSAVNDSDGEWFEIYNTSNNTHNLENVIFSDGSSDFTVDGALTIAPNSYLVFSINSDTNTNGGINVDYEYDNLDLINSGGQISIISNSTLIDQVDYLGFNLEAGKSLSLNPNNFNSSDNDNASNWCLSTNQLLSGDFGTPRAMNTDCN